MGKNENYAEIGMKEFILKEDYDKKIGKGINKLLGIPIISRGFPVGSKSSIMYETYHKNGVTICLKEERLEGKGTRASFELVSDIVILNGLVKKILKIIPGKVNFHMK